LKKLPLETQQYFEQMFINRNDEFIKEFLKNFKEKTLKISCFSSRLDSIVMWSHYAANHTGYCVEYNLKELSNDDIRKRCLFPVIYSDKLPDMSKQLKDNNPLSMFLPALYKSNDWKYEQEWRLIFSNSILPININQYIFPEPVCIYLGAKMGDVEDKFIKHFKENKIKIMKMKLKTACFKMGPFEPISKPW
jgi:hypothetical protein